MKTRNLQLKQMDTRMEPLASVHHMHAPQAGWLRAVRTSLGMSLEQLGRKMGIAKQSASDIERREPEGTVTINTLREAAAAMDMELVYGFVPKDGSLEGLVDRKSEELARKIVGMASQTMKLEDQENSNERIQQSIKERTREIRQSMPKMLWD